MTDDIWVPVKAASQLEPGSDTHAGEGAFSSVFNGDFRIQPPDPTLPIDNDANQLPGWTIGTVGGLTLDAFWDDVLFDTPCIRVDATAGTTGDTLYLEQTIATPGAFTIDYRWAVRAAWDLSTGDFFTRTQYLDEDGSATGAGADTSGLALANGTGLIPEEAESLRIRVGFELVDAGPTTATVGDIGAVYADRFPGQVLGDGTGTAFPASPATDDRFFRTDRGIEYFYDGTRWLSTTLYHVPIPLAGEATSPFSTSGVLGRVLAPFAAVSDIYLVEFQCAFYVAGGTALSASHSWTVVPYKATGNAVLTQLTAGVAADSGASSTWRSSTQAIGALLGTSFLELETQIFKVGTPGPLYSVGAFTCRLVG